MSVLSSAFSDFQEPFPAAADVWAGADNEVGEALLHSVEPFKPVQTFMWVVHSIV